MKRKGIKEATGPQKLALGPISDGKDVLLIAPTGYGKTEATFAPLLDRLKIIKNRIGSKSMGFEAEIQSQQEYDMARP